MKTPIADFIDRYCAEDFARLHMPGHKGAGSIERLDITEFEGADTLYDPRGIIAESEENATTLFGTMKTIYGTEGSSQFVKAMLLHAVRSSHSSKVIAARNAHSSFLSASALLDLDVLWLTPKPGDGLISCTVEPNDVDNALNACPEAACVFITSPDYYGKTADIASLSHVCHSNGVPLLVDNAHGAYLAFLDEDRHPIRLGADLCCDSAHKTLPALTGGAYLHMSRESLLPVEGLRDAAAVFASTSPSYLILRSLDLTNAYLSGNAREQIRVCAQHVAKTKMQLRALGFRVEDSDPLRIVIDCNLFGYTGVEIGQILAGRKLMYEYADERFLVLMVTPQNKGDDLEHIVHALSDCKQKTPILAVSPDYRQPKRLFSLRQSMLMPSEQLPIADAVGRVAAFFLPHCPPAVAPVVGGELIDERLARQLAQYGYTSIRVLE